MAWEAAGYAAALALLVLSGCMAALTVRLSRTLGRWERKAETLAGKADAALDEHARLAREACGAAEELRRAVGGFARVAEGAKAVGEAAETAAWAAANAVYRWRDRISSWAADRFPGTSADPKTGE